MESAIDIYGKLLIAVFSFIAPSMILLIGLFGTGITVYRKKNEDFLRQSEDLVTNPGNLPGISNDKKIGLIKDRIKNLDLIKKGMERDHNFKLGYRPEFNATQPMVSDRCIKVFFRISI